jgi:hypothetical protein
MPPLTPAGVAVKAAKGAAGAGSGKAAARKPVPIAGMSTEQTAQELAARKAEAARKASQPAEEDTTNPPPAAAAASPSGSGGSGGSGAGVDAFHSGSGFVLGLVVWVVAKNYLDGGVPQVRRLLKAKFFNQTGA